MPVVDPPRRSRKLTSRKKPQEALFPNKAWWFIHVLDDLEDNHVVNLHLVEVVDAIYLQLQIDVGSGEDVCSSFTHGLQDVVLTGIAKA